MSATTAWLEKHRDLTLDEMVESVIERFPHVLEKLKPTGPSGLGFTRKTLRKAIRDWRSRDESRHERNAERWGKPEWVSFKHRHPPKNTRFLISNGDGRWLTAFRGEKREVSIRKLDGTMIVIRLSGIEWMCWFPVPHPPSKEKR